MPVFADLRIPVSVVLDETALAASLPGKPVAVLMEAPHRAMPAGAAMLASFDLDRAPHAAGCSCCGARSPVAIALDHLFLARVKGEAPWFDRVVALCPAEESRTALAAALRDDAVTVSRFRADAPPPEAPPSYRFPPDEE
ncbi:hypothetical protein ACE7GA_25010 [Roseomonas sp. CCTCC AB2023176]|uniref:hypothetical protein n=1 Tax=Roseomonas sp. CCTCC AB2023176 TaxID=3342640 RepID=UPI0035DA59E7